MTKTTIAGLGEFTLEYNGRQGLTDAQRQAAEVRISFMTQGHDLNKWDSRGFWKALDRLEKVDGTPWLMAQVLFRGAAVKPVMHPIYDKEKGRMVWTKEAFAITYHVMLDFDTGDDRSSIDTLKADDFLQLFASFAYTTPSHTDESPRARVVFIVPEGIHDIVTLEALLRYLQDKFPHADASCKNADRIYYGSKGCKGWGNWSLLPLSLVESFVDEQLEKEKQARKAEVPEGYQRVTIETRGDHKNYVMRAVESEVERISSAAEGTGDRHRSLYEAALKLGGIAKSAWGGRYIDEGTITNLLMGAASANGYLQKYGETTTLRAITDGLKVASPRPKPSVTGIIPKAYMLA